MGLVRVVLVADRNGDVFKLYEIRERRFLRTTRTMKLETGELVREVHGTLIVDATGETLTKVEE